MRKRYLITLGAPTSAGGKVTSASSTRLIDGLPVALENDQVHCPNCGSDGVIQADGPRSSERWNGRQYALQDDLCICHCSPPPKLVNAQTQVCQLVDGAAAQETPGDASLWLRHQETREPFRHRPYRLHLTNKVIEGTTDGEGYTMPLCAADRANLIAWHVDGCCGS
jgi:uncharacterized Zn-binding protein involved in type VI secretion